VQPPDRVDALARDVFAQHDQEVDVAGRIEVADRQRALQVGGSPTAPSASRVSVPAGATTAASRIDGPWRRSQFRT
jgi:hypothetical protein